MAILKTKLNSFESKFDKSQLYKNMNIIIVQQSVMEKYNKNLRIIKKIVLNDLPQANFQFYPWWLMWCS